MALHESDFARTVKVVLDHGVDVSYIVTLLDGNTSYTEGYRIIFRDWVKVSVMRVGYYRALLSLGATAAMTTGVLGNGGACYEGSTRI